MYKISRGSNHFPPLKQKCILTPSTFLTLSQFISLENGNNIWQELNLFSLWCKKQLALAIKEKALKQNMVRSKCLNHFESQMLLVVHRMKNFWV